jgi:acetyl-CoA synthetase
MSEATRAAAEAAIDVLLQERREFPPSAEFAAGAVVSDPGVYERADADLDGFWLGRTREFLTWAAPPAQGLEWDPPHCTWFADGRLNVSANCLDRHVEAGHGSKVAYHFVPEPEG